MSRSSKTDSERTLLCKRYLSGWGSRDRSNFHLYSTFLCLSTRKHCKQLIPTAAIGSQKAALFSYYRWQYWERYFQATENSDRAGTGYSEYQVINPCPHLKVTFSLNWAMQVLTQTPWTDHLCKTIKQHNPCLVDRELKCKYILSHRKFMEKAGTEPDVWRSGPVP